MDRHKSVLNPRNLIICCTTCTVAAVWAVIIAAIYFYLFGTGSSIFEHNVTEVTTVYMYRRDLLPWYLNGTIQPTPSHDDDTVPLWPHQLPQDPLQRLRNQLMFLPKGGEEMKIVLFWSDWSLQEIQEYQVAQCPIKSCVFTNSRLILNKANAVVFRNPLNLMKDFPREYRPRSQVWIFNSLSKPGDAFVHPRDVFNWTATPRLDSDVPMFQHGIWMYYNPLWKHQNPPLNLVGHKSLGAAVWFPSSCDEESQSYRYVQRLSYHTLVDAYGGPHLHCADQCPRNSSEICHKLLSDKYRVTLVLEDRHCNHSIPDMFFLALEADTVPVVMFPPRSVYEQVVPEGSFIHTDDFESPYELAKQLEKIYANDSVFNNYLSWRGTGAFVKSWYCRLCAMLHHNNLPTLVMKDVNQWWNPEGQCFS